MPVFCRVDDRSAGTRALGILVPPGLRTVVILRPRPLNWDLLPVQWDGAETSRPNFCFFHREEAARIARQLHQYLEQAVSAGHNPVQTLGDPQGSRFQVWVHIGTFYWLLCQRKPGQSYQPICFTNLEEAQSAADLLVPIFFPPADANQEYYFNTQHFTG